MGADGDRNVRDPVAPVTNPRTEAFNFKTTAALALRFVALCKKLGISRSEGLSRTVLMWAEAMEAGKREPP